MNQIFWTYTSIFLLWNVIIPKDATQLKTSTTFRLVPPQAINATLSEKNHVSSLHECSAECLAESDCAGFLFQRNDLTVTRCKTVQNGGNIVDLRNMSTYKVFAKPFRKSGCLGVVTPPGWTSGCPTLYFSLDDDHGGQIIGPVPESLQFISG